MSTNVSVGPTTIAGWLTAGAGFLTALATGLTGSASELSGPGKWSAIIGLVALAITNIGRYVQAVQAPGAPASADALDPSLGISPAAALAPSEVPVDGVDGGAVPRAVEAPNVG
jgi:hypothetical protein